jgi:ketosteroid isomerase-like protein
MRARARFAGAMASCLLIARQGGRKALQQRPAPIMFHAIFKCQARATFELVNQHDYDSILAGASPNIRHRLSGEHALGGERNDIKHVELWFERLHRLIPELTLTVTDVWVAGGLRKTTVIVRWTAAATLLDGRARVFGDGRGHGRGQHDLVSAPKRSAQRAGEESRPAVEARSLAQPG